eukprot:412054_1
MSYNQYGLQLPLVNSNTSEIKTGMLMDVYDEYLNVWSIGQIIEIKDDKIKINWYGWKSSWDTWINKNDTAKLTARLTTHTYPLMLLSKPPYIINECQHIIHKSCLILSNYNYNIKTNRWNPLNKRASYSQLNETYLCAIDDSNDTTFCVNKQGIVHTINMNTKECKQHNDVKCKKIKFSVKGTACEYIDNKLYVMDLFGKYIYYINEKNWKQIGKPSYSDSNVSSTSDKKYKLMYIKSQKKFIALVVDNIKHEFYSYCCEYNSNHWIKKQP